MSTDWPYSQEQRDFQRTLARILSELPEPEPRPIFPRNRWTAIAEAGALGLTAPDLGAGALDVVAAGDALGQGGCPGPWWQTLLTLDALPAEDAEAAMAGALVLTAGTATAMPWGASADRIFELGRYDEDGWRVRPVALGEVREDWVSLGHEPVVAAELVPASPEVLVGPRTALLARLGLAAYLAGAGQRVLSDVVAYAGQRTQFRTRIGDFTAVAHPLAEIDAQVRAATLLTRRAADALDDADDPRAAEIDVHAALRAAARSSRQAVYQAHQTYGAIGFSLEGPLSWLGQRVAQLATEAERFARQVRLVPAA
ncbi:acyl-CoA dehydrogenase family protein [Streptosporangium sp. NBC_01810]|uniref:acyl-CoA dehydrogenase family protein n=1 Tax=Streptosporangium sp. NBC_01810 TaxID=2975951 RepID=UPI002DD8AE60|nr:acyl-CoA dehydrogenase family protein [Streptosporangium sp. NBC_01810]WSA26753.1 acyl-CoA dehydrogenase family protein [Streptosporangium sp. NBC_01810]